MSEQPERSIEAVEARRAVLAEQHGTAAEADRVLSDVLASAHASARESLRRLDAIAEQIERATQHQADLAIDTPMGAREFQKFLAAKQREITTVFADAHEFDRANKAVLESLRTQYARDAG